MTSVETLRTLVRTDDFFKSRTCEEADWRFARYLLLEYLISRGERSPRGVPFVSKVSRGGKIKPDELTLDSSDDTPLQITCIQKHYYVPTYLALDTYPGLIVDCKGTSLRRPLLATPRGERRYINEVKNGFEEVLGIDTCNNDWFVRGITTLLPLIVDANIDIQGIEETMWAGDRMIRN